MTDKLEPEFQQALQDVREVLAKCGPTANDVDRAYAIIGGCIIAELNTKLRICQIAKALGRNTRQVAAVLDGRAGTSPKLHDWYVDSEGRYWLHQQ